MTKDLEFEFDNEELEMDIVVDMDSINKDPLDHLVSVVKDMKDNHYSEYNIDQIKGLELSADLAYNQLSEAAKPYAMNERIYILLKIEDMKKEQGYCVISTVPTYDNEPLTKR